MKATNEQIIKALEANGGFQSKAAQQLGMTQSALTQRIKRSENLQRVATEIKDKYLDLAESKLITLVNNGNLGAICFYLKCQGKHRGYIEKTQTEVSGKDGQPIQSENKMVVEFVDADTTPEKT